MACSSTVLRRITMHSVGSLAMMVALRGRPSRERHLAEEVALAEAGEMLLVVGAVALVDIDAAAANHVQRGAELALALDRLAGVERLQLNPGRNLAEVRAIDASE